MTDLTAEINAAVRRDRALAMGRKYGPLAAVLVIGVLVAAGAYALYHQRQESRLLAANTALINVLQKLTPETSGQTAAELQTAVAGPARPLGWIARFYEAGLLLDQGKSAEAEALYRNIGADQATPPLYRELARLLTVEAQMNIGDARPDELRTLLTPLAAPDRTWRNNAREKLAVLALRASDRPTAAQWLEAILQDAQTPPSQRERVTQLLATLKP